MQRSSVKSQALDTLSLSPLFLPRLIWHLWHSHVISHTLVTADLGSRGVGLGWAWAPSELGEGNTNPAGLPQSCPPSNGRPLQMTGGKTESWMERADSQPAHHTTEVTTFSRFRKAPGLALTAPPGLPSLVSLGPFPEALV